MSTESQTDDEIKALLVAILEDPNLMPYQITERAIRLVDKTSDLSGAAVAVTASSAPMAAEPTRRDDAERRQHAHSVREMPRSPRRWRRWPST
jgi:hypothetical protein